jgi:hypothetical protein
MKRVLIFIVIVSVAFTACIKDRIQPVAPPVVISASDTLMYYWDFNNQDSSARTATFHVNNGSAFKYYCAYIDYTGGSLLNLKGTSDSGQCLRVRNPSDSLIFYMPTTGYDSISMQFAEEASSSGSSQNAISYTVDGVHFISTGLSSSSYSVDVAFASYNFSFAGDVSVKNNPKFAVKIVFLNNNTGTSGNDRIDNVSLMGKRL